jgi:hypothetical protein
LRTAIHGKSFSSGALNRTQKLLHVRNSSPSNDKKGFCSMMILAKCKANPGARAWQRWLPLLIRTPQGTGLIHKYPTGSRSALALFWMSWQAAWLECVSKIRFVSGHDFSRADKIRKNKGL